MAAEGISVPLAAVERMAVDLANDWGYRVRPRTDGVVETGGPRGATTAVVTLGRESSFAPGDTVQVVVGGVAYNARVAEGSGTTLVLYDVRDRSWRERILASIPAPQRVTAAALRERGLREGWLR